MAHPGIQASLFVRFFAEIFKGSQGFVGDVPLAEDLVDDAG
jgi:hypothetical protein